MTRQFGLERSPREVLWITHVSVDNFDHRQPYPLVP